VCTMSSCVHRHRKGLDVTARLRESLTGYSNTYSSYRHGELPQQSLHWSPVCMPRYFLQAVSTRSSFAEILRCVFRQLMLKTCRAEGCSSVACTPYTCLQCRQFDKQYLVLLKQLPCCLVQLML